MCLTSEEYDNLLEFSAFINKNYSSFFRNVGYGMNTFFHFPLTVCTVFDMDHTNRMHVSHIAGFGIYPQGLKRYQEEVWLTDLFVKRVAHYRQGKMQSPVLTIPDIASYEDFYATEYGRYLKRINTPYQATLRAICDRSRLIYVLCVFKTAEQGEFTAHELDLLCRIDAIFSQSVDNYMQYIDAQFLRAFLETEASAAHHNLAVIDERSDVVFCGDSFSALIADNFDVHSEGAFAAKLIQLVKEQAHVEAFALEAPATLKVRDCTITVAKRSYTRERYLQRFLFVYAERQVQPKQSNAPAGREPAPLSKLIWEYGLTLRESEITSMLVKGMRNKEIAEALHISIATAKFHVQNIHRKLGVKSSAQAVAKLMHPESHRVD